MSGGQAYLGQAGPRTGSVRHDGGNAADLKLFVTENGKKRYLDFTNPSDKPYFEEFHKVKYTPDAIKGAPKDSASTITVTALTPR